MPQQRTVFFISDGTGITAETLGNSLLAQFEGMDFRQVRMPFVDSADKAQRCSTRSTPRRPTAPGPSCSLRW
jgi:regulator of PEP synthase PpsR (kinase-PPPase family)